MEKIWRGMDLATLDREYNARASVADFDAEIARYVRLSAAARATTPMRADLVYDPESGCALDWFPGAAGGPVLLWVHGGYWRALSKADQSCIAPGLVAAGVHVAVMDYTLAPAATLDGIVHQVRLALAWVRANAAAQGADPGRLFAGGSSAGGHLCGMLMAADWQQRYDLPGDALRGGVTLSGLFDLEPVRLCHVNAWMTLDQAAAARNSPAQLIPPRGPAPRLLVAYGGLETSEFKRQSEAYAADWATAGHDAQVLPQSSRNHFDIVTAYADPADPLCRATAAFLGE